MHVRGMKHDNDNDPLSFITLAAATANVVRYLELGDKHKEDGERDAARERADKDDPEHHRDYVNQRLRELAAFERRFDGNKKRKV